MIHPELPGFKVRTFPDIFCPERQLIIHTVLYQDVIGLFYPDEHDMGKVRIVLRDIRVPLFDQFMEPGMYPVQAPVPVMPSTSATSGMVMVGSGCHLWTVGVRI